MSPLTTYDCEQVRKPLAIGHHHESEPVHDTAREHGRLFFQLYGSDALRTVVELGSQDVNGTLREHSPAGVLYIGLDVEPAKGVDIVVDPDVPLPLASGCADAVITSSAFEHDPCFWATFLELVRILRPGGLLYVNVPSNGAFHRYPLDCWRFYPDAGVALTRWAARNGTTLELMESFIGVPQAETWGDFVAVFRKPDGGAFSGQGCIADHAAAFNIHDRNAPPQAALRAESNSMPDMLLGQAIQARLDAEIESKTALAASLNDALERNQTLSDDLCNARQQHTALAAELSVTQGEVGTLRQSLSLAEQRIGVLGHDVDDLQGDLLAMRNSTSWRVTAPLRHLAARLRRGERASGLTRASAHGFQ